MTDGWRTHERSILDLLPDRPTRRPRRMPRGRRQRRPRYVAGTRRRTTTRARVTTPSHTRRWAWWLLAAFVLAIAAARVTDALAP